MQGLSIGVRPPKSAHVPVSLYGADVRLESLAYNMRRRAGKPDLDHAGSGGNTSRRVTLGAGGRWRRIDRRRRELAHGNAARPDPDTEQPEARRARPTDRRLRIRKMRSKRAGDCDSSSSYPSRAYPDWARGNRAYGRQTIGRPLFLRSVRRAGRISETSRIAKRQGGCSQPRRSAAYRDRARPRAQRAGRTPHQSLGRSGSH